MAAIDAAQQLTMSVNPAPAAGLRVVFGADGSDNTRPIHMATGAAAPTATATATTADMGNRPMPTVRWELAQHQRQPPLKTIQLDRPHVAAQRDAAKDRAWETTLVGRRTGAVVSRINGRAARRQRIG